MRIRLQLAAVLAVVLLLPAGLAAHVHVLWPKTPGCYGRSGEAAVWTLFWGHPTEMLVDDALPPKAWVRGPEGRKGPVVLREIRLQDGERGQNRRAFEAEFTPDGRGDYYLVLESPPVFIPEDKAFCRDWVKGIWHVDVERGWDDTLGLEVEIVPLTRPYGWPAGVAFTGKAVFKNAPLTRAVVEVERLSGFPVPPDRRPRDRFGRENSPLLNRTAKTDLNGYFTVTLDQPGWWVITVSRTDGTLTREGKTYPVHKRGCLWVHVEEPWTPPGSGEKPGESQGELRPADGPAPGRP
ncbi:MAG: DUF4198 domain-containing protein [Syntrophobacterales bacterium]|nr:DUF4198 domain-containing protein [Syntrophobacterales bacterium]